MEALRRVIPRVRLVLTNSIKYVIIIVILKVRRLHLGIKTGVYINCENCGKETYKTKTHMKVNKHHFCSQECSIEFRVKQSRETVCCEFCKESFIKKRSSPQRFCSMKCQNEWQKTRVGKLNPKFEL